MDAPLKMDIKTSDALKVIKRCQVGTTNYDDANDLHAECYGTLCSLLAERDELKIKLQEATQDLAVIAALTRRYLK